MCFETVKSRYTFCNDCNVSWKRTPKHVYHTKFFRKFYAMIFYFPFSLQFSNDLCVCVCFNDILGKNLVSAKNWSVRVKVEYTQTKRNMSCFKNLRWKVQIIKLNVSQNLNPEPMHFWLLFTNRRKLCLEVYQNL